MASPAFTMSALISGLSCPVSACDALSHLISVDKERRGKAREGGRVGPRGPAEVKWSHPSIWKGHWLWHGDSAFPDNPLISKFKLSFLILITASQGPVPGPPSTFLIFITRDWSREDSHTSRYYHRQANERIEQEMKRKITQSTSENGAQGLRDSYRSGNGIQWIGGWWWIGELGDIDKI